MKRFIIILSIIVALLYHPLPIDTNVYVTVYCPRIDCIISRVEVPIINHKVVKSTAYNATKNQCDSTPNIMAWNDKITKHNKNKVIAVSRDLLPILPHNTEVYFEYDDKIHKKIVLDKMSKYARKGRKSQFKIQNSIDILMSSYWKARRFGRKEKQIFWYGGKAEMYTIEIRGSMFMIQNKLESILIPGCKIMHVSKLGYVRVKGPDGQDYYISTSPPDNPAMYADAYAFTKMAMYLECGKDDEDTSFECFYRRNPYSGGFTMAFGLSEIVNYLERLEFTGIDIDYLKSVWNFPDRFWEYLRAFKWKGILKSLREGTMTQPFVPIHQINAKLTIADFIETRFLNLTGGPTMVGTKALRMTLANPDVPWIEMAARRASSYDTGMMIAKYSYIGGAGKCIGTSLAAAGKKYGIPIKGTSSHSSVLAFETQQESFRSQFDLFGKKSVLILDTNGYIRGAQDAIQVAREMGMESFGGRIDTKTTDLAFHSKVLREILDGNGFYGVTVVLSNDIDEYIRKSLREQGAKNDCDGVGTAMNPPPLGIVYKPVMINGRQVIKLSCPDKINDPSTKNVYRLFDEDGKCKVYIATQSDEDPYEGVYHHRSKDEKKQFSDISTIEQILVPVLVNDQRQIDLPSIYELRERVACEADKMLPETKRFDNPVEIPLYLSKKLWETKQGLMKKFQIVKEG